MLLLGLVIPVSEAMDDVEVKSAAMDMIVVVVVGLVVVVE
jgi:hypothetical protein